jgi:hypothetical protein
MVALRAALRFAARASARIRAASWLVTKATRNSSATVAMSSGWEMRSV